MRRGWPIPSPLSRNMLCFLVSFIYNYPKRFKDSCKNIQIVVPWCSGYCCCTASFSKAWTQVLRRFKSCSLRVEDSRWWGSLTMVPAGNKAKGLSSVNHTAKTIHHHHHTSSNYCWPNLQHWCLSKLIKTGLVFSTPTWSKRLFYQLL